MKCYYHTKVTICTMFGVAKFIESAPTKEVDATLGFCKA